MAKKPTVWTFAAGLALATLAGGTSGWTSAAAGDGDPGFYLRGGVGLETSESSAFFDRDCARVSPPALFGCVAGNDGRPIGGRGDFGSSIAIEGAIGFRPLPALRLEAVLGHRPHFSFSGSANFLGIQGRQSVDGDATQTSAMLFGYVDIAPLVDVDFGRFEPFVGAGFGAARNTVGAVTYSFPDHTNPGFSRTSGGSRIDPAWAVTVGTGIRLTDSITFDLSYRYSDYGRIQTDPGPLRVVRETFDTTIDVDATEARLTSHAAMTAIRYSF